MKDFKKLTTMDKVIHDPQYYQAERHNNMFNSFQSARVMEVEEENRKYNGVRLFPNCGGRTNA